MPVSIACVSCGTAVVVPEHAIGKMGRCTVCGQIMALKAAAFPPPQPESPPPPCTPIVGELPMRNTLARIQRANLPGNEGAAEDDDGIMHPLNPSPAVSNPAVSKQSSTAPQKGDQGPRYFLAKGQEPVPFKKIERTRNEMMGYEAWRRDPDDTADPFWSKWWVRVIVVFLKIFVSIGKAFLRAR